MKKTNITIGKNTYKLYSNVEGLYDNWLLETEEGHLTLTALEDSGVTDEIAFIEEIANDPETPWEACDEDDEKYIALWLSMWGITPARIF